MPTTSNSFQLNKKEKQIIRLAALGGMLEFYDFIIYGIFSIYFADQFFLSDNPLISVIKSYVVFVLGYIARPIGGIIFSHFGDEHGRKKVLVITIVLMGLSSLGIGLLPTYHDLGLIAPIFLLIFRLIQGLALGGELPATYVYISESIPDKQGTAFGLTMIGVHSGLMLGMLINHLLNMFMSIEALTAYGWRIPFIFGGLLCLISYRIRKALHETAAFNKIQNKPHFPLLYLFKHHFSMLMTGIAITGILSALVIVTLIFMPTYLKEMLNINPRLISHIMLMLMLFNTFTIYLTGKLANHWSPINMLAGLLGLCAICVPFSFWLISQNITLMFIGLIILSILEGIASMLVPLIICTLFSTTIRLTGVALCYNIGFTLFGGLAPIIISSFVNVGYNVYATPTIYLLMIASLCGLGLLKLKLFKMV